MTSTVHLRRVFPTPLLTLFLVAQTLNQSDYSLILSDGGSDSRQDLFLQWPSGTL